MIITQGRRGVKYFGSDHPEANELNLALDILAGTKYGPRWANSYKDKINQLKAIANRIETARAKGRLKFYNKQLELLYNEGKLVEHITTPVFMTDEFGQVHIQVDSGKWEPYRED